MVVAMLLHWRLQAGVGQRDESRVERGGGCGHDGSGNVVMQGAGREQCNKRGVGQCNALLLLWRKLALTMMGGIDNYDDKGGG